MERRRPRRTGRDRPEAGRGDLARCGVKCSQTNVGDEQLDLRSRLQDLDACGTVRRADDGIALLVEYFVDQVADGGLVIDDQDRFFA